MTPKIRSLLTVLGTALVGGTLYALTLLQPQYSVSDFIDAGGVALSTPARLSCRVRILDECRQGPNASRPKYVRMGIKARKFSTAGAETFAIDVPDAWRPCIRLVGDIRESCDIVEDGACSVPAICAANADPQPEVNACACRQPDAGTCTVGGQAAKLGVTLAGGTWTGAGCRRKYCGPVAAGEQTADWPQECPER